MGRCNPDVEVDTASTGSDVVPGSGECSLFIDRSCCADLEEETSCR